MMKKKKNDIFINLIGDVTPIKKNNKLERNIPVISKTISFQERTKNKLSFSELKKKSTLPNISNFEIEINKTNKKLKKGKIPIDKKIDFHGLSLFDAESLFTHTINICYKKKLFLVPNIHLLVTTVVSPTLLIPTICLYHLSE